MRAIVFVFWKKKFCPFYWNFQSVQPEMCAINGENDKFLLSLGLKLQIFLIAFAHF